MGRRVSVAVCVFVILLFMTVVSVEAVPPLPASFWGPVYVDGAPVPTTTPVVAWVGGTPYTGTRAMSGTLPVYTVDVGGSDTWDPNGGEPPEEWETIVFKIGDKTADQKPVWHQGENHPNYTLTASSVYSYSQPITTGPSGFSPVDVALNFSTGCSGTVTITLHNGILPDPPTGIAMLSRYWDMQASCSPFSVTISFRYHESDLNGVSEADIVGVARYDSEDGWVYLTGDVDTDNNTVTISDVTEFSTWALIASAPPKAIGDLGASRSGNDLVLSWSPITQDIMGNPISGVTYRVYRDTTPYFTPSDDNCIASNVSGTSYTDPGTVGDPDTNYYYVVEAVDASSRLSGVSNRIGEFDFALTPGTSTKYNLIALPLEVPIITNADSLADYVGSGVQQVLKWDASTQQFVFRIPHLFGTNFAVQIGGVYYLLLDNTAPTILTFIGGVPDKASTTFDLVGASGICKFNFISIPLDKADLSNADGLADDIGGVQQVLRWDASTQQFVFRIPHLFGTNFSLRIGYPYAVCLDDTAPATWPTY